MNPNIRTEAPTTIPDLRTPLLATKKMGSNYEHSQTLNSAKSKGSNRLNITEGPSGERYLLNSRRTSENIPYPFLEAFIDRKTDNRFSKRVYFRQSDQQDLLEKLYD